MLHRLKRKLLEISRYASLAYHPEDRRDLWALSLWRNRILSLNIACRLTKKSTGVIMPRLTVTGGQPVRLHLGDYGEVDCFDELFINKIYQLDDVPFAPDLVVDCGAYRGYFCALARGTYRNARMVCFEPNPEHQESLDAQLVLLSAPVEKIMAAVGTMETSADFAGCGMGGAVVTDFTTNLPTVKVRVVDFPRWLATQKIKALVWKLDVEGAEAEILPHALSCLPARTALFLETHYPEEHCHKLLSPYAQAGFSVRKVRQRQIAEHTYIEWFLVRDPTP
jgi:FkbM family methyltransferase